MNQVTQTGLVLSDSFRAHTAQGLPERPERIDTIRKGLESAGLLDKLVMISPPERTDEAARNEALRWIHENHHPDYIEKFRQACARSKPGFLTSRDTPFCEATFDVTVSATGSVLRAAKQVAEGALKNAFCTVRPPGHHAEENGPSGFCYVNHIAVAARYLLGNRDGFVQPDGSRQVFDRVLIVDIDLHHGNGAQHSFENDDRVMFCSLHGHPNYLQYPGSGFETECGKYGNILNIPFLPGSKAATFHREFERQFLEAADRFKPHFVLVSAGFDMHRRDPLNFDHHVTQLNYFDLQIQDFAKTAALLVDLARRHCNGRLVGVLEGGYNLDVLGPSVAAHVAEYLR